MTRTASIALVGRPNVGKSTIFNRLTRSRKALVANLPGLTRDRQYGDADLDGEPVILIDTGGLGEHGDGIDGLMAQQSWQAFEESDLAVFIVDARAGFTAEDDRLLRIIRKTGKPLMLVVNKIDGLNADVVVADFHATGFGDPLSVSATHNRGMAQMREAMRERLISLGSLPLPEQADPGEADLDSLNGDAPDSGSPESESPASKSEEQADSADGENDDADGAALSKDPITVGIIGRPNVGKSTLVNRILGEDRVVVFDAPGTTRDSIDIPLQREGRDFVLIDTAGVRRRGRVHESVEKFSIVKTLDAIRRADVALLIVDAREGLVEQDLHLLGYILDAGRGVLVLVNKWDGLSADERASIRTSIDRRLTFAPWIEVRFVSALHGSGVGDLYQIIEEVEESAGFVAQTHELSRVLTQAVDQHPPPMVRGRRIKLRFAHPGGHHPPTVVVHGNQTKSLPDSYVRYLENTFREALDLKGTPIRIDLRSGENPFANKRNVLTERQRKRRKRMIRHVKKRGR